MGGHSTFDDHFKYVFVQKSSKQPYANVSFPPKKEQNYDLYKTSHKIRLVCKV